MCFLPYAFKIHRLGLLYLDICFYFQRLHALGTKVGAGVAEHVGIAAYEAIGPVITAA